MDTNGKETKVLPDTILIPQQHTPMRISPESVNLEDYKSSSSPCSPVTSDIKSELEIDSGQKLEPVTLDKKLEVEDFTSLKILADACELVASSTQPSVVHEEHILDNANRLIPVEIKWKRRRLRGAYENSGPPVDDFRCKHCNRTFTSYQALGGHMTSHNRVMKNFADHDHDQLISSKFKSEVHQPNLPRDFNALYGCNTCGRHFSSSQALGGHRSRTCKEVNTCSYTYAAKPRHDLVLGCHLCSAVLTRYSSYLDHLSSSHPNHANKYVGHRQDQSSDSAHSLFTGRAENKSEHQTETHKCRLCTKAFPTGQALGGHQRLNYKGPTQVAPAEISHEQSMARKQVEFDLNEIPAMEDEDAK